MKNILVVEDNATSLFLTKRLLNKTNSATNVIGAENGLKALEILRSLALNNENLPEVILLDLNMPVLSGFEFLNSLANESFNISNTKIIVLSSSSNQNDIQLVKASPFPVSAYLTKPLTTENMKDVF